MLRAIHVDEGCRVPVGTAIAVLMDSGDEAFAPSPPEQARTVAPGGVPDGSVPPTPLRNDYAGVDYGDALLG